MVPAPAEITGADLRIGEIRDLMNDRPVLVDVRGMPAHEDVKNPGICYRKR
jgi:hypothetical protein